MSIRIKLNNKQCAELYVALMDEDNSKVYTIDSYVGYIEFTEPKGMLILTNSTAKYVGNYRNSQLLTIIFNVLVKGDI